MIPLWIVVDPLFDNFLSVSFPITALKLARKASTNAPEGKSWLLFLLLLIFYFIRVGLRDRVDVRVDYRVDWISRDVVLYIAFADGWHAKCRVVGEVVVVFIVAVQSNWWGDWLWSEDERYGPGSRIVMTVHSISDRLDCIRRRWFDRRSSGENFVRCFSVFFFFQCVSLRPSFLS